jgi:hypothetical protein
MTGSGKEVVPEGRRVLDAAIQFAAAPTRPPPPALVQNHAQDAVDAEPGVPEAGVMSFISPSAPALMRSVTTWKE